MAKSPLSVTHPELAKQWHPIKNGSLSPTDVTPGSDKKVWWKCNKADDHQWETSIKDRAKKGYGCPFCSGKRVSKDNNLAILHPELAKEWHPTKNGSLTPEDVTHGSHKKVWWKCTKGADHEWEATVYRRVDGIGCLICSGRKAVLSTCLATTHPEIAKQWHPNLNEDLTPKDLTSGSNIKIWWQCDKGVDHIWKAPVYSRTSGKGCPMCAGYKVVKSNCLATTHPDLAKEWHPEKNGELTPSDVTSGSHKVVWWKCNKGPDHVWKAGVHTRSNNIGCPVCHGLKVVESNCLATTHPELSKEWHPNKNGSLTPKDVIAGSHKSVWWVCDKGPDHEYKAIIKNRTDGHGCSVCAGITVVLSNCLATIYPELSKEWHPIKNGALTPYDVLAGTHKKVWWQCKNNPEHIWPTEVVSRTSGSGCPYCFLAPQSREELTILFELKTIFPNINPKGHKIRVKGKLYSVDIFIPELNLVIEYDGSYWHKDKYSADLKKSKDILSENYKLIRIRESPLKSILDSDIMSSQPFNYKSIVDALLKSIKSDYQLSPSVATKISSYLKQDEMVNQDALVKYINKVFIRKAKKENEKIEQNH